MTAFMVVNIQGHPPVKLPFPFKVIVWDDPIIPTRKKNDSADEIMLYTKGLQIRPSIFSVNRKSQVTIVFKPKAKKQILAESLNN
jgi:hypothetical protein